jgi:hypothetical protein
MNMVSCFCLTFYVDPTSTSTSTSTSRRQPVNLWPILAFTVVVMVVWYVDENHQ